MKDRVVCVKEHQKISITGRKPYVGYPIVGEIYTVYDTRNVMGICGYSLCELHPNDYWATVNFRPVDDTFGPAICETIEQQIELEKVLVTN